MCAQILSLVKFLWLTAFDHHYRYVLDLCSLVFEDSQEGSLRMFYEIQIQEYITGGLSARVSSEIFRLILVY